MRLEDLICLHDPKTTATDKEDEIFASLKGRGSVFVFTTCQRNICVLDAKGVSAKNLSEVLTSHLATGRIEVFRGWQAYAFLLRVLCGLESKVFGETEVFGQFKSQWWKVLETRHTEEIKFLNHWVPKLFSDVKKIRSEYLAGFGGSSYASLCKNLLEKGIANEGELGSRLLGRIKDESAIGIIGFGKLAQSMCSVFKGRKLIFWNRSMVFDAGKQDTVCSGRDNLLSMWKQEDLKAIIVTIPVGSDWDLEIAEMNKLDPKTVVHLGAYRQDLEHWRVRDSKISSVVNSKALEKESIYCLDDIFELSTYFQPIRKQAYESANSACEKHSKMRLLGNTLHATHCWEDLAFFSV